MRRYQLKSGIVCRDVSRDMLDWTKHYWNFSWNSDTNSQKTSAKVEMLTIWSNKADGSAFGHVCIADNLTKTLSDFIIKNIFMWHALIFRTRCRHAETFFTFYIHGCYSLTSFIFWIWFLYNLVIFWKLWLWLYENH